MRKHCLVLAGPSGVGKSTVADLLMANEPSYKLSISATTRARRDGESDDYIHIKKEEFASLITSGEMLEYTEYNGNFYGTPKSEIDRILDLSANPLLILDLKGVESIKQADLDIPVYTVYIYEDINVVEQRLYDRDLKSEPSSEKFLSFMKRKKQNIADYMSLAQMVDFIDAFVENSDAEGCASELLSLLKRLDSGESFDIEKSEISKSLRLSAEQKQ